MENYLRIFIVYFDNVVDITFNTETGDIILKELRFLNGCDKIINQIPLINIEYFDNYKIL